MSSLSTRSGTHHACPQGISSPLLRPRSSPPAPAPEVKPGLGRGWAWPAGGQGPASIPALQLCPLVTSNTHTRGGSPFLPTGGAVRPAPSPLPASGSSGCAPEPTHAHTHVPGTPHVHMPHARTHARTRQVRSVTWDCSSPTRAVSSEMFPSSTFSFVSGRLYYRLLRDVTGNISHVAPRRA